MDNDRIKEEWIINNSNTFEIVKNKHMPMFAIQKEIVLQLEKQEIKAISDFLNSKIEIKKEILGTEHLTIEKILIEFLGFENINLLKVSKMDCGLILSYLQLTLLEEYYNCKTKNILFLSEYKKQYKPFLNNFLNSNIDTDEEDFINEELKLCDAIITELSKPIYNKIGIGEVLDEPCEFKKHLTNSINKRKKFLNQKLKEVNRQEYTEIIKQDYTTTQPKGFTIKVIDDVREDLYNIIKEYFEEEQHEHLLSLLRGGEINGKLIFKGKANQLADTFNKLMTGKFITFPSKKKVAEWIANNFQTLNKKGEADNIKGSNILKSMTDSEKICANPLIDISGFEIKKSH